MANRKEANRRILESAGVVPRVLHEFAGQCFRVGRSSFGQPTGARLASTQTTARR